jgi:hypothetical protein
VAAVIVAPAHWQALNHRISEIKDSLVPPGQRPNDILHATDVFSGNNGHKDWPVQLRIDLMKSTLGIFRHVNIPFALGACFRNREAADHDEYTERMYPTLKHDLGIDANINHPRFRHTMAMMQCLDSVDKFIIRCAPAGDTAIVLAEDAPKSRGLLANFTELVRQRSDGKLETIAGGVHFAKKGSHPFLELADILAFTARRYLSNQSFGEELMNAIQPYMTVPMGGWGEHYLHSRICFPRLNELRDNPATAGRVNS